MGVDDSDMVGEGVDPMGGSADGERAVEAAVWAGDWEAVGRLMDAGGVVAPEPGVGGGAFLRVLMEGPEWLVERVIGDGAVWGALVEERFGEEKIGENPIVSLLEEGRYERLEWLWGRGLQRFRDTPTADLDWTPLMHAVKKKDVVGARWLLGKGADVDARAEFSIGDTALDRAVMSKSLEMVELLVGAGANPNIPTWMWLTAVDRLVGEVKKSEPGSAEHDRALAMWAVIEPAARRFAPPVYADGSGPGVWPPGV